MDHLVIERSIWIAAAREKVWQAVTNPDQVVPWMVPNLPFAQMKLDNGKMTMFLGEMGIDFVIVEKIDEPREFVSRAVPDRLLTTSYKFEDQKDGTQVTVTMSGFEGLPDGARQERLNLSSDGWDKALKNLKAYVEGKELPYPTAYVSPLFGYWSEPKDKVAIERSIWIEAAREKVWKAITDPKLIQKWFSPNTEWHLTALEVGGRYYVDNPETNGEMYVEIIEVVDAPGKIVTRVLPEPPDTVVKGRAYTLIEESGGTRLILTLTGYDAEPTDERWAQMEQNTFGFGPMLENIKALVEGKSIPFPDGF